MARLGTHNLYVDPWLSALHFYIIKYSMRQHIEVNPQEYASLDQRKVINSLRNQFDGGINAQI